MVYIVVGWLVFVLLIWMPVENAHAAFCFNNYDLGIYGQALALISLENLNPFLSTRNIKIFNDHFDPILFLFSPLTTVVEPSLLAIRVEMAAVVVASMAPIWLWLNRLVSKFEMMAAFFVILFSPMTLMATFYPSHPGTWALAPLAWTLAFLYAGRDRLAITTLVFLLACKEEFPVFGGFFGLILILQNRIRVGFCILTISVVWFCSVFFLRPVLLGQADYYTSAMMAGRGLTALDTSAWLVRLSELLFLVFTPVVLLRASKSQSFNSQKNISWQINVACMAFVLIIIRVVGGYWGNHRAAPLAVLSGFMLIGADQNMFTLRRLRQVLFIIFMLGTAAPFLELGSRVWIDKPFKKHCPATRGRIDALNEVVNYLSNVGGGKVLAGGNIVPHLVRLPGVAQVGATNTDDYRFFVVETYEQRNTWPISPDEMKRVEHEWRNRPGVIVLRDDQHVLLLEYNQKR